MTQKPIEIGVIGKGYKDILKKLKNFDINAEQWLNGSFCTTKKDPNDLDLLSIMDKETIDNLPHDIQEEMKKIFSGPNAKPFFNCDSYAIFQVPETHPHYDEFLSLRTYWKGQFGFDREDTPKGIVRFQVDENLNIGGSL